MNKTEAWQAFLRSEGVGSGGSAKAQETGGKTAGSHDDEGGESVPCVAPAAAAVPAEERSVEQQAELAAWEGYVLAMEAQRHLTEHGDIASALGAAKLVTEARKAYIGARKDRESEELARGQVIRASSLVTMRAALQRVADIIAKLPAEICVAANPDSPVIARIALQTWLDGKFAATLKQAQNSLK